MKSTNSQNCIISLYSLTHSPTNLPYNAYINTQWTKIAKYCRCLFGWKSTDVFCHLFPHLYKKRTEQERARDSSFVSLAGVEVSPSLGGDNLSRDTRDPLRDRALSLPSSHQSSLLSKHSAIFFMLSRQQIAS